MAQGARQFALPLASVRNLTGDNFSLTAGRQNFPARQLTGLSTTG